MKPRGLVIAFQGLLCKALYVFIDPRVSMYTPHPPICVLGVDILAFICRLSIPPSTWGYQSHLHIPRGEQYPEVHFKIDSLFCCCDCCSWGCRKRVVTSKRWDDRAGIPPLRGFEVPPRLLCSLTLVPRK
jgi:hypothetical protein